MNSSNGSGIDSALLAAPFQLNIWLGTFLWATGNVGCLGNLLVFSSRTFRKRAYSIYLFFAALSDLIYFNFVLVTRILQRGYRIPIVTVYLSICKLRQFYTVWGNVFSFTLYSLATLDRLLSTERSNKYRQWSNRLTLSYKMVFACALIWFLGFGPRLILYQITSGACVPPPGFYSIYDNYLQVVFSSFSPSILMPILGFLLIRNVRAIIRRRVGPGNEAAASGSAGNSVINQMDSQLTLMLILESAIAGITYFPYGVRLTYGDITQGLAKSPMRVAVENVIIELIHLFSYIFFASSFYVSFISNSGFRRQCMNSLHLGKAPDRQGRTNA